MMSSRNLKLVEVLLLRSSMLYTSLPRCLVAISMRRMKYTVTLHDKVSTC